MPLLDIWRQAPEAVERMNIEQIVTTAGDGVLKDGSACSAELREYLSQVPSARLREYVEHCLASGFAKSGMVLQDLVNELGRRLEYKVTNGRYQGTSNAIGSDGLWLSPEAHSVVAEVKTTDAYRIALDTIAGYREKLKAAGQIAGRSSILIVVGREDTGELEAQVRGSRHAWDIRLISADALIKLVQIKESAEAAETGLKIRSLLAPMEYTRLDRMIDVMFAAARDVEVATAAEEPAEAPAVGAPSAASVPGPEGASVGGAALVQDQRERIVAALARRAGTAFIKRSRALFWDARHARRVACAVSKRHANNRYWYGYHPRWHDFLSEAEEGHFVLGCTDLAVAFALPLPVVSSVLDAMNTTTEADGQMYWHVHLVEVAPGRHSVLLPKRSSALPLDDHRVALG